MSRSQMKEEEEVAKRLVNKFWLLFFSFVTVNRAMWEQQHSMLKTL